MNFWTRLSRLIIKGRIIILLLIAVATYFLALQTKHLRFSYTEANMLPADHEVNVEYGGFLDLFGEEGNIMILGVKDSTIFNPEKFNNWNALAKIIDSFPEIDYTLAIGDVKKLVRDDKQKMFVVEPIFDSIPTTREEVNSIKKELFEPVTLTILIYLNSGNN